MCFMKIWFEIFGQTAWDIQAGKDRFAFEGIEKEASTLIQSRNRIYERMDKGEYPVQGGTGVKLTMKLVKMIRNRRLHGWYCVWGTVQALPPRLETMYFSFDTTAQIKINNVLPIKRILSFLVSSQAIKPLEQGRIHKTI